MYFDSLSAFWAMGGHGFYVWCAFILTFIALISIQIYVRYEQKQLKQLLQELKELDKNYEQKK